MPHIIVKVFEFMTKDWFQVTRPVEYILYKSLPCSLKISIVMLCHTSPFKNGICLTIVMYHFFFTGCAVCFHLLSHIITICNRYIVNTKNIIICMTHAFIYKSFETGVLSVIEQTINLQRGPFEEMF